MKQSLKVVFTVFSVFAAYFIIDDQLFSITRRWLFEKTNQLGVSHLLTYLLSGIPLFIGTAYLCKSVNFIKCLDLNKSFIEALYFSFICTIPMLLGFAYFFELKLDLGLNSIIISGISAALFEEVYYRGFLFGQLYKNSKLGFLPSVIVGALIFALIHLYQSEDFLTLLGIFTTTFLGALLFSWVYAEWEFNIWYPVLIHFFMNTYWLLFSVSDNALGNEIANVFRFISIGVIIGYTVFLKRKSRAKLKINKGTLWLKKS